MAPDPTPPAPKLSPKSLIGAAFLLLIVIIASVRPDEPRPAWTRELPVRITPPLERPLSPVGSVSLSGTVLSAKGHPLPHALVLSRTGELLAWNYSDIDGHFTLTGLRAGPLALRVIGDGHEPEDFPIIDASAPCTLQLSAALPEPPLLPELTLVDITGTITPPRADLGLEGYELWLEPMSPPEEFGSPLSTRAEIQSDRSFSIQGLIAGRYRAALLPPWAKMGTWPNILDHGTPVITVGLSEPTHLDLKLTAGEIEGTVIDERGALVPHALVGGHPKHAPNQVWPPTRTDQLGHFTLRDIPVGIFVLHAHAGELAAEHTLEMPASSTLKVDLSLR